MKKIPVEAIEDGMILSREVCGPTGNILLTNNTLLSAALGRRLKNWGIPFVYVEGDEESKEVSTNISISPEILKSQLMDKFSDVINNPIMKQIFVAVYNYRMQKNNR